MYAAQDRLAAFLESLQDKRPNLEVLARMQRQPDPVLEEMGRIDEGWNTRRRVGRLKLGTKQRWMNLQSVATTEVLRREFAELLLVLGMHDFDVSIAGTTERRVKQSISRWAYERGFQGIKYTSRKRMPHSGTSTCFLAATTSHPKHSFSELHGSVPALPSQSLSSLYPSLVLR